MHFDEELRRAHGCGFLNRRNRLRVLGRRRGASGEPHDRDATQSLMEPGGSGHRENDNLPRTNAGEGCPSREEVARKLPVTKCKLVAQAALRYEGLPWRQSSTPRRRPLSSTISGRCSCLQEPVLARRVSS